ERGQEVEAGIGERGRSNAEAVGAERLPQGPFVEGEFDVEGRCECGFERGERGFVEALRGEALMVDVRRALERAAAQRIALDRGNRAVVIAERGKGLRHQPVDDLEIAAAGELLELDE